MQLEKNQGFAGLEVDSLKAQNEPKQAESRSGHTYKRCEQFCRAILRQETHTKKGDTRSRRRMNTRRCTLSNSSLKTCASSAPTPTDLAFPKIEGIALSPTVYYYQAYQNVIDPPKLLSIRQFHTEVLATKGCQQSQQISSRQKQWPTILDRHQTSRRCNSRPPCLCFFTTICQCLLRTGSGCQNQRHKTIHGIQRLVGAGVQSS